MPFNITPNTFKNLIISGTGDLCEKVAKLLVGFATASYNFVSEMFDESGNFTDNFKTMLCAAGCTGSNGTLNPNMPAPSAVSATDGAYSDKVRITWNAVTPPTGQAAVTEYKVYRSLSTVTDSDQSVLIATVTAPTLLYDDTSAVVGTLYNYWVRATNGTQTSNYGGPDVGNAGTSGGTLTPISDLLATQGHSDMSAGYVTLAFTAVAGANKYDIYRHTVNDFAAATIIGADKVPVDSRSDAEPAPGDLWDNVTALAYLDEPALPLLQYYYWVVAKSDAPPNSSAASNVAQGWVWIATGFGSGSGVTDRLTVAGITVPGGVNTARVRLWGNGGDGAGGNSVYGGGGAGGGCVIYSDFTVAPGDILAVVFGGAGAHANTAAETTGNTGQYTSLELNAVEILRAGGGVGGVFNPAGGGTGGAGGTASGTETYTAFNGAAGEAAVSPAGGRGGHAFGEFRVPAARTLLVIPGPAVGFNGDGLRASGGSGSSRFITSGALATGGKGGIPFMTDANVGGIVVFEMI